VEYQPSAEYQEPVQGGADGSAERIARAGRARQDRTRPPPARPDAVLVSLARAGTPVGVLMRRWARHAHGLELPH